MEVEMKIINDLKPNTVLLGFKKRNEQINQIIAYIENHDQTVIGKENGKNRLLHLSDCFSFFTSQKSVYVNNVSLSQPIKINDRLYTLQDKLPKQFIRISNTEIINLNYVQEFEISKSGIILIHFRNHYQTSSSRRYLKAIKERIL
ncbi:LytTR family DNA-binding domain-containing protein [Lentilactobacillus hilgardii]|uniref:LytTR family DNA-binding domain-containing protein n=1 Tax=Lentilactobacillus hilgardii TaxID=1588 RepID=UPI003FA56A9E